MVCELHDKFSFIGKESFLKKCVGIQGMQFGFLIKKY